jgi:hypothetical protein
VNGESSLMRVLEKYRLRNPVPPEARARMIKAKKDTLRYILEEKGEYPLSVRAALPFYRAFRGTGLALSFRRGRMITGAMAAVVVAALFAGAWTVSRPFFPTALPDRGMVIFARGEATRTDARGKTTPLRMRDFLERGDRVLTGDESAVIVQVGETILVRIEPRSELAVDTVLDDPNLTISLRSGKVLAKLRPLRKGRSFTVKTPTVAAAVRGTAFSVATGPPDTVVVAEGSVLVTHAEEARGRTIVKGSAFDAGIELKERPATDVELLEIERILRVSFIEGADSASHAAFESCAELVNATDAEIDAALAKLRADALPRTLDEIRAKYGRIDVVTLYSGERVRGAIVARGAMIKMLIPGRYRSIPSSSVRNTAFE